MSDLSPARDLSRMRVSDADRNGVIGRLHDATSEGRLTLDEFEVRMTGAVAARTWSELDPLVDDLPDPPEPAEPAAETETDTEPLMSPVAAGTAAAAVLGLGAVSIVVSFWSAWGNALGLAAVVLGVVTLLAPGRVSAQARAAILTGVILGLLPTTFYAGLFLVLGI